MIRNAGRHEKSNLNSPVFLASLLGIYEFRKGANQQVS